MLESCGLGIIVICFLFSEYTTGYLLIAFLQYFWNFFFFLLCQPNSLGLPEECADSQEEHFSSKCQAERRFEREKELG